MLKLLIETSSAGGHSKHRIKKKYISLTVIKIRVAKGLLNKMMYKQYTGFI